MEVHLTPAKGGCNATTTSVGPAPNADRAPHANSPPHGNFPFHCQQTADTQQLPNASAGSSRSPTIHSHQYAYQPIPYPLNTLPSTAHSNTIHSRHSPSSNRPPILAPVQPVVSTTDVTSVDSVAVQGHSNADPLQAEQQQADRCATRAAMGTPKKNSVQRQVEFPQRLSPISADRHAATGVGTSGASAMQPIDVEN